MKKVLNNQRGAGHLVVILAVVVVALVGLAGWWVLSKNGNKKDAANTVSSAIQQAVREAKCEYDDKDLCKFFASWKVSDSYSMTSKTSGPDDEQSSFSMKIDGENKTHMTLSGDTGYEVITIGDTTYTKDTSDGKWWKQTLEPTDENPASSYTEETTPEFEEPDAETVATQYKKIGKEACGGLTCFKYQIIEAAGVTQHIWFDDEDYQLRRMQHVTEGVTTDTTFSYNNVSVKAPSPTKELGANQYIVPGQSEPMTLPETPSEADIQALMEQYQAELGQ